MSRPVGDYEIVDHGLEHSSYFQGCGTALTPFHQCATGIGDTYADALDNALESVAQCGYDTEQLKKRILRDNGWDAIPSDGPSASEEATAAREVEYRQDEDTGKWFVDVDGEEYAGPFDTEAECEEVEIEAPEESELWYHVSIRWINLDEGQKRIQSIRADNDGKLPSFAWPGGYPIVYHTDDNANLCPACANGENRSEASEFADKRSGWRIVDSDIHYEGEPIVCDHCDAEIESAYGNPEETSAE